MSKPEETSAVPITIDNDLLPDELFIFPLTRRPFFPGMAAPIIIEPGFYYEMLKRITASSEKTIGLFLTKEESSSIYGITCQDLHPVGVAANILKIVPLEQGGAQIILNMEQRIRWIESIEDPDALRAKVQYHHDHVTPEHSDMLKAYSISIITTIKDLLKLNPLFKEELQIFLSHSDFTEPGKLADFAVALTTASREELQEVMNTLPLQERIEKTLILMKKELDINKLQNTINQKIEANISKTQREFFLREQLKTIRKELGQERDPKTCDEEKFRQRLQNRTIPQEALEVIEEELNKLHVIDTQSPEYSVLRNYIDWLTSIPWGIRAEPSLSIGATKSILEEDHYGLEDIKSQILEFISVGKLRGGMKGNILCLVGPPGVGKTSIGKSVARALQRPFYRFSVGGMRDEAEIKGHRRTYIGSMPGKIIQALKVTGVMNPLIMIDEIDKLAQGPQGDPGSALLEVLDPEQNKDFLDHYIDVRTDLSDVLFVVTANLLDTIPLPLQDRMDILRLSGYMKQEKIEIAKKYLIPKWRHEHGLKANQLTISQGAVGAIIEQHARDSGVRSLEKSIKKILRKIARQIVESGEKEQESEKISVTQDTLSDYLGQPKFLTDRYYQKTPPGVCIGLAWTAMGGAILYIESMSHPAKEAKIHLTGQAGSVMKESAEIAFSYVQHILKEQTPRGCPDELFHLHIPEGATPKDGPSAGVTMVTALLSLIHKVPVKNNLGMTGEITLTGMVLPIGGVKEKVIAAKRSHLKTLILPSKNKKDYEELPQSLKQGFTAHIVSHYREILPVALPKAPL
ncbi:MAG: endopeptidase La [Chlamydiota bacterium]|nr:endopeptidase La [Chlamydiota bacterium]